MQRSILHICQKDLLERKERNGTTASCRGRKRQNGSERIAGTESKSETEKLLRKALEDYEDNKFVAKADNLTVGELLDMWAEEELKTGTLSNGTVENYLGAIRCIKKHPIADRKLKTVTAEHLQSFLDLLTFGGEFPDGKVRKGYSKDYIHSFSAVLQQSFR